VKEVYKISQLCQTVDILWMIPLFCDGEKKPGSEALWEARTDKIVLRASLALDEALKTLETLPEEYRSD
uniref:TIR domain-containing protein n=1 Tax=Steinernema glaseri TaxID=37863 RepID=A0A1I8ADX8_9BILA